MTYAIFLLWNVAAVWDNFLIQPDAEIKIYERILGSHVGKMMGMPYALGLTVFALAFIALTPAPYCLILTVVFLIGKAYYYYKYCIEVTKRGIPAFYATCSFYRLALHLKMIKEGYSCL